MFIDEEHVKVLRMRHFGSLAAALLIGPLAWLLIAFGQDRTAQTLANGHNSGDFQTSDFLRPLLLLAAAGVLLGLIATLRFSPVGAVVAGVGYAVSSLALPIAPKWLLFSHNLTVAGQHIDPTTPIRTGTTLLVGAVLMVAVASIGRWRRRPPPGDESFHKVLPPPDDTFSFAPARDRGLGADWVGEPDRSADLEPVPRRPPGGETAWRDRSDWATSPRSNYE
jgi:hypothetical protein